MVVVNGIFGNKPNISRALYIADNSFISGEVILEEGVSIWPNCSLRADLAAIIVGKNTNIQENTVIHNSPQKETYKKDGDKTGHVIIGENSVIGHSVILHSCKIGSNCLVGMGSIVMDESIMEDGSMLAAGSLLTPGKVVKSGELWAGSPAKFFRNLTELDTKYIKDDCEIYLKLAKEYKNN